MARNFSSGATPSGDITCPIGANNFAFGPGSVALILQMNSTGTQVYISVGNASTARFMFGYAAGALRLWANANTANDAARTFNGKWMLLGVSKASGTAAPRFHLYDFAAGTWTHANSGTSIANSSAGATNVRFAMDTTASAHADIDLAVAACWNVVLTDTQFESLAGSLGAWYALNPKGMWLFDQSDIAIPVLDITGNHADQSAINGTTISTSQPPIWVRQSQTGYVT